MLLQSSIPTKRCVPANNLMEVILQCLDDLDDLVCAFAQIVERLRWPSLIVAFGAALGLVVVHVGALPGAWGSLSTSIAVLGLATWGLGSSLSVRRASLFAASAPSHRANA
jgi:hypothetical protein